MQKMQCCYFQDTKKRAYFSKKLYHRRVRIKALFAINAAIIYFGGKFSWEKLIITNEPNVHCPSEIRTRSWFNLLNFTCNSEDGLKSN